MNLQTGKDRGQMFSFCDFHVQSSYFYSKLVILILLSLNVIVLIQSALVGESSLAPPPRALHHWLPSPPPSPIPLLIFPQLPTVFPQEVAPHDKWTDRCGQHHASGCEVLWPMLCPCPNLSQESVVCESNARDEDPSQGTCCRQPASQGP